MEELNGKWEEMFQGEASVLRRTDPEFVAFFESFALEEVVEEENQTLPERTRMLALLATLLGCQGITAFEEIAPAALDAGLTPVEAREVVYQAAAYLGIGRTLPFLKAINRVFTARGIVLPLEGQSTTSADTRREAGTAAQVEIFGEGMQDFWRSGPEESRHINRWLAANCFGDYYTRTGLDLRDRELITFCFLSAQGGCEPQLTSHAGANMRLGNDKAFLIRVISQCLPYIGYPRSLNALSCVNRAAEKMG